MQKPRDGMPVVTVQRSTDRVTYHRRPSLSLQAEVVGQMAEPVFPCVFSPSAIRC